MTAEKELRARAIIMKTIGKYVVFSFEGEICTDSLNAKHIVDCMEQYAKQEKIKVLEGALKDIDHCCQGHSTKSECWKKIYNKLKELKTLK